MIISASYRTDIPAFYSQWFVNRLRAGYCRVTNPYGGQVYAVDLRTEAVDGFVFWTKNLGPLLPHLVDIRARGNPFVVQYTITGYPRELEERVVRAETTIHHMHALARNFCGEVAGRRIFPAVWRYDPILLSNLTPISWHVANFTRLTGQLEGTTDEVVFSFAHLYQKTLRNLRQKEDDTGVAWGAHEAIMREAEAAGKAPREALDLVATLAQIAHKHGMRLRGCSQPEFLVPGVEPAHCVDSARLADVALAWGLRPSASLCATKEKGNRVGCRCSASRDIGEYDTCPHGCVYCYAVRNRELALTRYKAHDPQGEFLFAPIPGATTESRPRPTKTGNEPPSAPGKRRQLPVVVTEQRALFGSQE